jgi:hypothetical protein
MTKAQIAAMQAELAALRAGQPITVEPIADQAATAASPWITAAQAAVPKVAKAVKVQTAPKPLKIGFVATYPKPDGDQFEPYTMLSIENHAHGKAYRSYRLRVHYVNQMLAFLGIKGSVAFPAPPKL